MRKIKDLLNSPKEILLGLLGCIILVGAIGMVTVYATNTVVESVAIGSENAKNFAFVDAGIDPADAKVTEVEFDWKHDQFVYEIEFFADGVKYDYWVKSSDGAIVKKEMKIVDESKKEKTAKYVTQKVVEPVKEKVVEKIASTNAISLDQAKEIAVKHAGLSTTDVIFKKAKQDKDHGSIQYEIEFYYGYTEYSYEIDAASGEILEYEIEQEDDSYDWD